MLGEYVANLITIGQSRLLPCKTLALYPPSAAHPFHLPLGGLEGFFD
jgi:hypothetical protein